MPRPTSPLAQAIDALTDVAALAGLDPAAARDEGLRVAAALAESVKGAAIGWAAVARPDLDGLADLGAANLAFAEAASRGRRWRATPTDLLTNLIGSRSQHAADYAKGLSGVASAALLLGHPEPWAVERIQASAAGYLAAAGAAVPGGGPSSAAAGTSPTALSSGSSTSHPQFPATSFPAPSFPATSFPDAAPSEPMLGLPPGPGTDAVMRGLGYVRDPSARMPSGSGADPAGLTPAGTGSPGAQAGPPPAASQQAPAEPAPEVPAEPEKTVEELLDELDAMIGLDRVKKEIRRQVALLTVERLRAAANLKAPKMSRHLIFVGNPGTGKTTVARLIGAIYRALELLPQGQLVEVDRSELVAGYVGQTAMKTAEVVAKAVDGVLFIDEAYALAGDQFAQEAVNTLVKEMEDHRQNLVVIVAGYPDPMVAFIAQNPGLASRFTTTIEFDDYTDDELVEILRSIAAASDYELTPEAEKRVRMTLQATVRGPAFGNGRFSRNQFEHAVGRHAWRLQNAEKPSRDDLRLLLGHDFFDVPEPDPEMSLTQSAQDGDPLRVDPDATGASHEAPSKDTGAEPSGLAVGRSTVPSNALPDSPEPSDLTDSSEPPEPIDIENGTPNGTPNEDHA